MKQYTIVLDAGHGGRDSGVCENGIVEKDYVLALTLEQKGFLEALGYRVFVTRDDDTDPSRQERAEIARLCSADLVISNHINGQYQKKILGNGKVTYVPLTGSKYDGLMTFCLPGNIVAFEVACAIGRTAPRQLARDRVEPWFVNNVRGHWTRRSHHVLECYREIPAVLVEWAFATNKTDVRLLQDDAIRAVMMATLHAGVMRATTLL